MNFFHHKDLGNNLLQLCPKVVKHPVYSIPFSEIMLPFKQALYYIWTSYIINLSNSLLITTLPMQDKVPSNVVCLVFGSSCLMNGKKHILLDNVCSLPYSLCHWQHILYNSSRQCTHTNYTCNHLLHLFYLQILTAYVTIANQSSVTFVLFTNTYSLYHYCKSVICYICSIYKYLQLMSLTAHFVQQFRATYTCNLHLQISHLLHLFCLQILTVYVTDSTFYTTVQGNVHMQFTYAIIHLCYTCSIYKYYIMVIPITISSTLLMAEKELNHSVSQKKSDTSAGHT